MLQALPSESPESSKAGSLCMRAETACAKPERVHARIANISVNVIREKQMRVRQASPLTAFMQRTFVVEAVPTWAFGWEVGSLCF